MLSVVLPVVLGLKLRVLHTASTLVGELAWTFQPPSCIDRDLPG